MAEYRFRPWVGERYAASPTRLLVVGESHYGREDEDDPSLTSRIIEGWQTREHHPRYLSKLGNLLSHALSRDADRRTVLNDIAFYNYVQILLSIDNRERPSPEALSDAQEPFLAVVRELDPTHILVTGVSVFDALPEPIAMNDGNVGGQPKAICQYPTLSGRAWAIGVPHLSRTSIGQLVPVVAAFIQMSPIKASE